MGNPSFASRELSCLACRMQLRIFSFDSEWSLPDATPEHAPPGAWDICSNVFTWGVIGDGYVDRACELGLLER